MNDPKIQRMSGLVFRHAPAKDHRSTTTILINEIPQGGMGSQGVEAFESCRISVLSSVDLQDFPKTYLSPLIPNLSEENEFRSIEIQEEDDSHLMTFGLEGTDGYFVASIRPSDRPNFYVAEIGKLGVEVEGFGIMGIAYELLKELLRLTQKGKANDALLKFNSFLGPALSNGAVASFSLEGPQLISSIIEEAKKEMSENSV